MKICILALLVVGALAVPQEEASRKRTDREINEEALLAFSLLLIQMQGEDAMASMAPLFPFLFRSSPGELDYERQLFLLSMGGLSHNVSESLLTEVMPLLMSEGKTTEETIMTLLFFSKQICKPGLSRKKECSLDVESILPLIRMIEDRGCRRENIESDGDMSAENEMCLCHDQSNALFWVNLVEQFTRNTSRSNSSNPDQFPFALMMALNQIPCTGHLKVNKSLCRCSVVTEGNDPMFMQYLFTSEEVKSRLTPEQRRNIRDELAQPQYRILNSGNLNVNDYLFSLFAQSANPQTLSLLQNQNSPDRLRQIILSSIGLDTSLLQVVLNGGFQDGPDRVALISYLTNLGVLDSSIIPLLLGVNNGQNFYVTNLVESGSLDPSMALLLLASQAGLPQEQLLDILIEGIVGVREDSEYFTSLGRPYIPPLPSGIYPGSQLFFAHFETLGVNTCSLHDLRNRYDCGYIGISAAECETVPYCCYNPIFLTDVEVRNATNNAITSATAVPWCYYNVFFVYYNSFYMPVQRPGGFASPIQCRPLFKFGINIDPNLYNLYNPANPTGSLSQLISPRTECGFPGITEFHCVAIRGCCWDGDAPFRVPQCFNPNGPSAFDFNPDSIPIAYRPANGTCNRNTYQIPLLYYVRVACHYTLEFYNIGYNILAIPNRLDCLTKLGCCYESDDSVIERYPFTPRCYQREGGLGTIPSVLPSAGSLFRGGRDDIELLQEDFPRITDPKLSSVSGE